MPEAHGRSLNSRRTHAMRFSLFSSAYQVTIGSAFPLSLVYILHQYYSERSSQKREIVQVASETNYAQYVIEFHGLAKRPIGMSSSSLLTRQLTHSHRSAIGRVERANIRSACLPANYLLSREIYNACHQLRARLTNR